MTLDEKLDEIITAANMIRLGATEPVQTALLIMTKANAIKEATHSPAAIAPPSGMVSLAAFAELQTAAQKVVDETDRIHDNDPSPIKYRAPYGAITELRAILSTHYGLRAPPSKAAAPSAIAPGEWVGIARRALAPFAEVGQWLFARPMIPDSDPVTTLVGINGYAVDLTRGHFKAAHSALALLPPEKGEIPR